MFIVAVVGPTATGKSGLAVALAEQARKTGSPVGEVVNADAFALYQGMDIGTAKVTPAERRGVPHHQIDVLGADADASVAHFQEAARTDIAGVLERGARPIVVGGSGLYVRAVLDHINFPGTDPQVREALERRVAVVGPRALYTELQELDPTAAASIGPANSKRLVRALEVIELTGKPFSANLPKQEYVQPTLQIGLDCDRETLDARVVTRVHSMWERGLVSEVEELLMTGMGRTASRAVGYSQVLAYLRGDITEEQAIVDVITQTRRLTRKQMGWFGRDPRVHWLSATAPDLTEQALALIEAAETGRLPAAPAQLTRRPLGSSPAGCSLANLPGDA